MADHILMPVPPLVKDRTGNVFGRLTVLGFAGFVPLPSGKRSSRWLCKCDCGNTTIIRLCQWRYTKSCGCAFADAHKNRRSGYRNTPEDYAFRNMKARCTNKNRPDYIWYGARGIEMKYESFEQFIGDVGMRPTSEHSIDRIDNDGHYEPGNCKWSTHSEQAMNRRIRRDSLGRFQSTS